MPITITKPTVGGSNGAWGTTLNTALDALANGAQSATWVNVKDYGAKGDGVTDDTTAINAAITAVNAQSLVDWNGHTQVFGGAVMFPPGFYLTSGITMLDNVYLIGGRFGGSGYQNAGARLSAYNMTSNSYLINQGTTVRNGGVIGFSMHDPLGATSTNGCFNLPAATNFIINSCTAENWGVEALILNTTGGGDCTVTQNFFQGLMNTALASSQRGAATFGSADLMVSHNEFAGPSSSSVSSGSLFCAAAIINGTDHEFDHNVFESADIGCVFNASRGRMVGNRFDTNAGHGLQVIGGSGGTWSGNQWGRNSFASSGSYDHINVPSGGGSQMTFVAPGFSNYSSSQVRYCINDQKSSATFFNTYLYPHGDTGGTGFSSVASSNPSQIVLNTPIPRGFTPKSGGYQLPSNLITSSPTALTAGQSGALTFLPYDVGPNPLVCDKIGVQVTVAQSGGTTTFTSGIYPDDGTSGAPNLVGGPIASVVIDLTAGTGNQATSFGSVQTLQPGRYWIGTLYLESSAPTTRATIVFLTGAVSISNSSSGLGAVVRYWNSTGQSALPTTAISLSAGGSTTPMVGLHRQ